MILSFCQFINFAFRKRSKNIDGDVRVAMSSLGEHDFQFTHNKVRRLIWKILTVQN